MWWCGLAQKRLLSDHQGTYELSDLVDFVEGYLLKKNSTSGTMEKPLGILNSKW